LISANTIKFGANLGAMAASANLLIPIPSIFWLFLMTIIILLLEVFISYQTYAKFLKYLAFSLLAYIVTAFVADVDWIAAIKATLIPRISLSMDYVINIVAIFGTTISPYLFFWQADEEVEEQIAKNRMKSFGAGQPKVTPKDISNLRKDTMIGMFFSNIVMWFIIVTTGTVLYTNGTIIQTPHEAAEALRPFAGDFAFLLFAAGIIGTGFLAVPVLSGSAAYAVSEAFNLRAGLDQKFKKAHGFYGVIIFSTLIGVLINFLGIPSMAMLYYSAVINGLIAPILLVMIVLIANRKEIMQGRTNSKWQNFFGILTILIMASAGLLLIFDLVK
jgi:Mn2+/Fe2+ NRAMP family transporter